MIWEYDEWLEKALEIAIEAHKGQFDKSGKDYILHPLYLMVRCKDGKQRIVAVLHDVVEDSNYTLEDIKNLGFDIEIIEALDCLTHKKGEDYFEYIKRVKTNELATYVKCLDLAHNGDISRLKTITEKDVKRVEKYAKALQMLRDI